MTDSLDNLISNSPFEHIKPRRVRDGCVEVELAMPFPKPKVILKWLILFGLAIPICCGCIGAFLMSQGSSMGLLLILLGVTCFTLALFIAMLGFVMVPVALKPFYLRLNRESVGFQDQARTINFPWSELEAIVDPVNPQEKASFAQQKEGLVVKTNKGTFRVFNYRSPGVCKYIVKLIEAFAGENQVSLKVETLPELDKVKEIPFAKTPEFRIKGPLSFLLLAGLACIGIFFETKVAMLDQNWSAAEGTITRIEPHEIRNNPGVMAHYEYEVEGNTHVGHYFRHDRKPDENLPEPAIGKKLELKFNPVHPAENQLRRKPDWILMTVMICGCLVSFGLAVWFFVNSTGENHEATDAYVVADD